jgi:hypothetical protein
VASISVVYIAERLVFRAVSFFRRWYGGGFVAVSHVTLRALTSFDQSFAVAVHARNLTEPLYQDHSPVGHVLGFLFRLGRVVSGSLLYLAIIVIATLGYAAWAAVPAYLAYRIFIP